MKNALSYFIALALTVLPLSVSAQQDGDQTAEAQEGDFDRSQTRDALFTAILENREEVKARMDSILERLPELTQSVDTANETVDEIIAELKRQAEFANPNSEFVANIDRLMQAARRDAGDARTAGYEDFEQDFLAQAEEFESAKDKAGQYYKSLDRRIRAVEAERERIVFMIKLERYKEAQAVVNEGLEQLRETEQVLAEIEQTLPQEEGTPD